MSKAFGKSLLAYWRGDHNATHTIERDDGHKEEIKVEYLFSSDSEWPQEEIRALEHINPSSRILDVGCGVGRVAVYLQENGHDVVGLDSCPQALQIAEERGLEHTFLGNICSLNKPPVFDEFDVVLMFGNNFGLCGKISKTEDLLIRLNSFLSEEGLLIFSSVNPFITGNPLHLSYHERNREKGYSPGLIHLRIVYRGIMDDWWDLLFVDPTTAERILKRTGFRKRTLYQNTGEAVYYVIASKF
ncbi:MAG: class I SAM-dependent methyltransferase [Candidatus Hodarchaeales archaeon]|jgi:SAM-dependent methyltransferase